MSRFLTQCIFPVLLPVLLLTAPGCTASNFIKYYTWNKLSENRGEGKYAEIDDIRMYYQDFGNEDRAEAVLLIHGGFAFGDVWFYQIPDLAAKYRLIVPDSRGHGRTADSSKPISYAQMASDMAELLDHLGIEKAYVIGWSDGGDVGLHMALEHPSFVDKLVLFGTPYNISNYPPEVFDDLKEFLESAKQGEVKGLLNPKTLYKRLAPDPDHWPVFCDKMREMWLNSPTLTEEDLGRITAPTLVISVDRDEYLPPEVFEATARSIPNATIGRIPQGTHFVMMEYPDETNELLLDFLSNRE